MTPELPQCDAEYGEKSMDSIDWKAAALSAGRREAKAAIYAENLEKVALVLFICNMVLLFLRYL